MFSSELQKLFFFHELTQFLKYICDYYISQQYLLYIDSMKGNSNQRACKCKQHVFILKPLLQQLHRPKKVQLSLCENISKNPRKKVLGCRKKCCPIYPIMNTDKNYATPAFILENQKQHFLENKNVYLRDHSRKTMQNQQIENEIYFPIPKSNYDFCNVCGVSYTDHIEHIRSMEHHKQIKLNKFNDYILDLEETLKTKQLQETGKRSIQQRLIEIDQDSQDCIFGHKKFKTDERTETNHNAQVYAENRIMEFKNYYRFNNYNYMDPNYKFQNPIPQNLIFNSRLAKQTDQNQSLLANFNDIGVDNNSIRYFYEQHRFHQQINPIYNLLNWYSNFRFSQHQQIISQNYHYQHQNYVPLNMCPDYMNYYAMLSHPSYQNFLHQFFNFSFNHPHILFTSQ